MAADPPLPWVAESESFCAGDRKAMQAWSERLLAATREALEREGAGAEMLADRGYLAWVAIDTFIAGLGLDRLDASSLTARVMLKAALAMAADGACAQGLVVSPQRAAKALAGMQLAAVHGLQLALREEQAPEAIH